MAGKGVDVEKAALGARITALEIMVSNAFFLIHKANKATSEDVKAFHKRSMDGISRQALPGADAATSDVVMDEIQYHIGTVFQAIEELIKKDGNSGG